MSKTVNHSLKEALILKGLRLIIFVEFQHGICLKEALILKGLRHLYLILK